MALFGLGTYYVDEHLLALRAVLRHANLGVAVGTGAVLLLVIRRLLGTRGSVTDPPG